jgi:hypothetical protein
MRWPFIPTVVLFGVIDAYARSILSRCAGRDATAAIGVVALIMQQHHAAASKKRRATIPRAGAGIAATFQRAFIGRTKIWPG